MTVAFHLPLWSLSHPLVRALAFGLILSLLVARLGSLTEEALVTPIEDAIFGVAFMIDAEEEHLCKTFVNKAKSQLDSTIPQGQIPPVALIPALTIKTEHVPLFLPRDLVADIFIPPEGVA